MSDIKRNSPISKATKIRLLLETAKSMQAVVNLVDQARRSLNFIDRFNVISGTKVSNLGDKSPDDQHYLRRLAEYTLVVGLIQLDITAAIRIYLNGTEPYDTMYATKQLLVTINEGYKQIYQYVTVVNGVEVDENRKKSYWVKDIGRLISSELPELLPEYERITKALDLYDDQELKEMTKPRNLAIHYDKNASKVYDMLMALDIEKMVTKSMPFIAILIDMAAFGITTLNKFEQMINSKKNQSEIFHINKLEDMKTQHPEAADLLSQVQEWVKNFGKL